LKDLVGAKYGLARFGLIDKTRRHAVTWPRQIAMWLCRVELRLTYPAIGRVFGGRDHTTALHACTKIERLMQKDDTLRDELERLRAELNAFYQKGLDNGRNDGDGADGGHQAVAAAGSAADGSQVAPLPLVAG